MVIIRDYDDLGDFPISLTANERGKIWNECMGECDVRLSRAEFDQIIK